MVMIAPSGWLRRFVALAGLTIISCGTDAEQGRESVATTRAMIVQLESPTTVEAGEPSQRSASCPGQKLPDQCGSWAGVELKASRRAGKHGHDADNEVSHCLCQGIDFRIPSELAVSSGHAGWSWDKPELEFRTAAGATVSCRYRGNGTPKVGGDKYLLDGCSNGYKAGQLTHSDWFQLNLDDEHPNSEAVEVQLRLGEPDVVDGVTQEQIFYSSDPLIPGAALHVPRGSAPAFETFSLSALRQLPPATTIDNAGDSATSLGYGVDVHADSASPFVFTPVAGASCPRIELPYDDATVQHLLGAGRESAIQAQNLTTLSGLTSGAHALEPAGAVTVNLAQHTLSFCVQHLSYWVATSAAFNASLVGASIRSVSGTAAGSTGLPLTDLRSTLPKLEAGATYEMILTFQNLGSTTWTSSNIRLVPVDSFSGNAANFSATSTWGAPLSNTAFTPTPVPGPTASGSGPYVFSNGAFKFNVTAPGTPSALNFCLRNNANPAFGECFTWDLPGATNPGVTQTPVLTSRGCYTGTPGTAGIGLCKAGTQTYSGGGWSACNDVPNKPAEVTCDGKDEDCNGKTDDGVTNACGTCGAAPDEVCDDLDNNCDGNVDEGLPLNGCGHCGPLPDEVCDGIDNNCDGAVDEGLLNACGTCGAAPVEVCDGVDNNCDGFVDEGLLSACGTCSPCPDIHLIGTEIDDEVYVNNGFVPPHNHGQVCHAQASGGFLSPFVPGTLDCKLDDPVVTDAGRAVFTVTLFNGGCFDTSGFFSLVVDGTSYPLPGQNKVLAHCGITHQFTFAIDLRHGGPPDVLIARSCINDGDCQFF